MLQGWSLPRWRHVWTTVLALAIVLLLLRAHSTYNSRHDAHDYGPQWPADPVLRDDGHPISHLIREADRIFEQANANRSSTFAETVEKYRSAHGRHPPPRFDLWYRFARERNVYNIDSFITSPSHIHGDLRPFWAHRPSVIRHRAAHAADNWGWGIAVVSVRSGSIMVPKEGRKVSSFAELLQSFIQWLPDMDIPVNRFDTPRMMASWQDVQGWLTTELLGRTLLPRDLVKTEFTSGMRGFRGMNTLSWSENKLKSHWNPFWFPAEHGGDPDDPAPRYWWIGRNAVFWEGRSHMELVPQACPPESHARTNTSGSLRQAEAKYKLDGSDFISNQNLSTDLCTTGIQLAKLHGILASPPVMQVNMNVMMPIFSESKMNVNNDILIPTLYDSGDWYPGGSADVAWPEKKDLISWRGNSDGGVAFSHQENDGKRFMRQRLLASVAQAQNASEEDSGDATLRLAAKARDTSATPDAHFVSQHADIAFTTLTSCRPERCSQYSSSLFPQLKSPLSWTALLSSKFTLALDGAAPAARFRAMMQSRSVPFRATIFRQWYDGRVVAWRDYVPLDVGNLGWTGSEDGLWSILAYFIGYSPSSGNGSGGFKIEKHDGEAAKIARQGSESAERLLRREDMEVYLFLLLLEYGRLIDDDRERLGLVGDWSEEMAEVDEMWPAPD